MSEPFPSPRTLSTGGVIAVRSGESALDLVRRLGPVAAGYALPFALVFYLAMRNGGYGTIVRSEVGIVIWWIVLIGAAVGAIPAARLSRSAWTALGLLGAFALWTGLAIGWSESSERSTTELARVATYLGVFAIALAAQGRDGLRRAVCSVGTAIAVVAVLALLSRLHPQWFAESETAQIFESAKNRLRYGLNYWNGLATLVAIGVPLLLWVATAARHSATRALAAAAIPALCLTAFYTLSRGGALELGIALIVLIALHPRRLALLPTLALVSIGSGVAIVAASQRDQLADGLLGAAAQAQADEMLAMVLVICAGVGLLQAALSLAAKYGLGPRPRISRRSALVATVITAITAVGIAVAAGVPGELSSKWDEFKDPTASTTSPGVERFESASGNGRYQYWQSALDANATDPLTGIGPGTFEYWWAREGTIPGFVRDAHSLYFETLAEVGIVGFALLVGLILLVLGAGVTVALRAPPNRRELLAAATAACFAFATAAALDWAWELSVLPVVFLILAAGLLSPAATTPDSRPRRAIGPRLALVAAAAAAIVAIAIPLAGTSSVHASQEAAQGQRLDKAVNDARSASEIQPYAATPSLQEAFVLELQGDFDSAVASAKQATVEEPTNWRTWLALSRLQARDGNASGSIAAYRKARALNPRSPLFAQ